MYVWADVECQKINQAYYLHEQHLNWMLKTILPAEQYKNHFQSIFFHSDSGRQPRVNYRQKQNSTELQKTDYLALRLQSTVGFSFMATLML